MDFEIEKAISILQRTPKVLKELLLGLSKTWTSKNEGHETWSPYDVIGHLIHGEKTDWLVRTKIILSDIKSKRFEPFDRFAQFNLSKNKSLQVLLDEFENLRRENLDELIRLKINRDQLNLKGEHPELGMVTLSQLLSSWVVHDLGHIVQISRVMAKQYKEEVGPWTAYLTVLK